MAEVTRRDMLRLSLGQFLAVGLALPALINTESSASAVTDHGKTSLLSWDRFLDMLDECARDSSKTDWSQDDHVQHVASLARKLNFVDGALGEASARDLLAGRWAPTLDDLQKTQSFQVTLITFDEGEAIPLHNHPSMTGVMTCARGSIEVDEFDLVAKESSGETTLRFLGTNHVKRRDVRTLTARDRNLHAVRAKALSQVVDIFTPAYDECRVHATEWYEAPDLGSPQRGQLVKARRLA